MSTFAKVVLYGYVPFCVLLFGLLPVRRALIWCWLLGFLFLPQGRIELSGLPEFDRIAAMSYGSLLGAGLFAGRSFARFRPALWDLPILVFCLVPAASAISNGFSAYDAVTASVNRTLAWFIPYFLARVLLTDLRALRELAVAIVIAGILYLPLCWYEIRMSPQLHSMVYGYQWRWQGMRLGGWRPQVFLHSGLPLGIWMTAITFITLGLRQHLTRRNFLGIPGKVWLFLIPLTTLLCHSLGALLILVLMLSVLFTSSALHSRLLLLVLILLPALYTSRVYFGWRPDLVTDFVATYIDSERAGSFNYRVDNEDILIQKALERPFFGWGGYGRNRVYDERGRDVSVTDGLWIVELGKNGLVGMITLLLIHLCPGLLALRLNPRLLFSPALRPLLLLGLIPTLYMIEYLPNGFPNPVVMLAAGGIQGSVSMLLRGRTGTG